MRKGPATRERILEIAEASVLAKGFGATSIEEIIAEAGITKSGFFYHFKDKNALARAMLDRYVELNNKLYNDVFERGRQLSDDPLQSFLIGLNLFAEEMAVLPNGHPGCLVAAISYQERLFDRDVRAIVTRAVAGWNEMIRDCLVEIVRVYPAREPVDADRLAEMCSCLIDGAIIMTRTLSAPQVLPQQILMFRSYIKMLFQPVPAVGPVPLVEAKAAAAVA
jgi:AcrR family transcriptional regulator